MHTNVTCSEFQNKKRISFSIAALKRGREVERRHTFLNTCFGTLEYYGANLDARYDWVTARLDVSAGFLVVSYLMSTTVLVVDIQINIHII
jgi:RNAse (barnase) inhibitor barstar